MIELQLYIVYVYRCMNRVYSPALNLDVQHLFREYRQQLRLFDGRIASPHSLLDDLSELQEVKNSLKGTYQR
jgi:hypothetical protein